MDFETCIASAPAILMEGALGERLKREYGLKIDGTVAMASLVYNEEGRLALEALWNEYIAIARKYHLPFVATTPTRRANKERVEAAGYDESIIIKNIELLQKIRNTAGVAMYVGGLMGCKGDAYTGEGALNIEQAVKFHSWQANLFKAAKADFLFAGIMPVLDEAVGMATAMSGTGIPYIISFTIRQDGKLIDGHTIDAAIRCVDAHVANKPVCYMTNCVHPLIVHEALSHEFNRTEVVRTRFLGAQVNTSALSYSELDGADNLKTSSPIALAEAVVKLKAEHHFKIFGGCCGTDNGHMDEIAKRLL